MPLLNSRSPESELQCWIDYWSGKYRVEDDNPVMTIAASHSGYLTIADVVTIFGWKLKGLWPGSKIKAIESFDLANPGVIRSSTASALGAKTDFEALKFLRALPGMQSIPSVAVASSLLMVLDKTRWTVMDRRANTSLVALKIALSPLESHLGILRDLYLPLHNFNPVAPSYEARDLDWGNYLLICREISRLTNRDLRTIDRALYMANGSLDFVCGEKESDIASQGPTPSRKNSPAPLPVTSRNTPGPRIASSTCICHECFLEGLEIWISIERNHVKEITQRTNRSDGRSFSIAYGRGYVEGTLGTSEVGRQECLSPDLFQEFWAARQATGAATKNDYLRPVEGAFKYAPSCSHCEGKSKH